jgi:hypothetical protein
MKYVKKSYYCQKIYNNEYSIEIKYTDTNFNNARYNIVHPEIWFSLFAHGAKVKPDKSDASV